MRLKIYKKIKLKLLKICFKEYLKILTNRLCVCVFRYIHSYIFRNKIKNTLKKKNKWKFLKIQMFWGIFKKKNLKKKITDFVCVCVCVCVWERVFLCSK